MRGADVDAAGGAAMDAAGDAADGEIRRVRPRLGRGRTPIEEHERRVAAAVRGEAYVAATTPRASSTSSVAPIPRAPPAPSVTRTLPRDGTEGGSSSTSSSTPPSTPSSTPTSTSSSTSPAVSSSTSTSSSAPFLLLVPLLLLVLLLVLLLLLLPLLNPLQSQITNYSKPTHPKVCSRVSKDFVGFLSFQK